TNDRSRQLRWRARCPQVKHDPFARHTNMARTRHYAGQGDTSLRHTAGFLVASSLAGLGSLHAQTVTCSPAAVTADPSPVDTAYPPVRSEERRVGKDGRRRWSEADDRRQGGQIACD